MTTSIAQTQLEKVIYVYTHRESRLPVILLLPGDLVMSVEWMQVNRGLHDRRQLHSKEIHICIAAIFAALVARMYRSVSYTHLTLPTIYSV